jgi:rhamnosyltransferase
MKLSPTSGQELLIQRLQKKDICAVIVTYNPGPDFPGCAARIAEQVQDLLFIDNNSNSRSVAMISETCSDLNAHLILNRQNLGVATGLNIGVSWAKRKGYQWILTIDQDTLAEDNMVETLMDVYNNFAPKNKIAVIGSNYFDVNVRRVCYKPNSSHNRPWEEMKTVITSGSLVSLRTLDVIGPFRDEFFIDHVDHDYCLRARLKGFKILLAPKPIMQHAIGSTMIGRPFPIMRGLYNHSPTRWYYMLRNEVTLAREYIFRDPMWVIMTLYCRLTKIILMCLFDKNKLSKIKFAVIGLIDGMCSNFSRRLT